MSGLSEQVSARNVELRDLMIDIAELVKAGRTNAEIHNQLEINEDISEVIQLVRTRGD